MHIYISNYLSNNIPVKNVYYIKYLHWTRATQV